MTLLQAYKAWRPAAGRYLISWIYTGGSERSMAAGQASVQPRDTLPSLPTMSKDTMGRSYSILGYMTQCTICMQHRQVGSSTLYHCWSPPYTTVAQQQINHASLLVACSNHRDLPLAVESKQWMSAATPCCLACITAPDIQCDEQLCTHSAGTYAL